MELIKRIQQLKQERNAVILAHNYQLAEVQDIADFTGDSLGLSIKAAETQAEVIVFCGVYFMAETAKILSPQKIVLAPEPAAGCPMAQMITAQQLRDLKAKHPLAKTMCYVNSTAEVKAECDFCCTSANAVQMLNEAFDKDDEIIFVPDKYLASYAAAQTGRNVIVWPGYCATHARILPEHVLEAKKKHPQAEVLVHPECNQGVVDLADQVLSTSGMLRYAGESSAKEFIVGTEIGMLHPLKKALPDKDFYPVTEIAICPNMKKTTLPKVLRALEENKTQVELPEDIIRRSQKCIQNMISIGRKKTVLAQAGGRDE